MQEKNMRYGQFIRSKRISDSRELTLKDVAEELGVSVSFVSDVEQGRRKPYDEEKTEKLIEFLRFTDDDIMMYSEAGEMARFALRMTKKGVVSDDDWKRFIHYIKTKEGGDDD